MCIFSSVKVNEVVGLDIPAGVCFHCGNTISLSYEAIYRGHKNYQGQSLVDYFEFVNPIACPACGLPISSWASPCEDDTSDTYNALFVQESLETKQ